MYSKIEMPHGADSVFVKIGVRVFQQRLINVLRSFPLPPHEPFLDPGKKTERVFLSRVFPSSWPKFLFWTNSSILILFCPSTGLLFGGIIPF